MYYFAGNVLFKTNENGTHYEIIKIFKTLDWYSDIPITGWEHGASHTQEEWDAIKAAYISETDEKNGYQSVRINKNTGKKEVLDESGSSV